MGYNMKGFVTLIFVIMIGLLVVGLYDISTATQYGRNEAPFINYADANYEGNAFSFMYSEMEMLTQTFAFSRMFVGGVLALTGALGSLLCLNWIFILKSKKLSETIS